MTTKLAKRKRTDRQKMEDRLDDLYRDVIRKRAMKIARGCQVRIKCKHFLPSYTYLHTAHIFSRGKRTVRWDLRNAVGACYLDHSYLDTHPEEKKAFFRKFLGDDEFEQLSQLASKTTKETPIDYKLIEIYLTEKIKELEG